MAFGFLKKAVGAVGKVLKKPAKIIGGLGEGLAPILGATGIGAPLAAAIGGGGALLQGKGIKGALKGAAKGGLGGLAGKALGAVGKGGLLSKVKGVLGGKGLPGSSGSLIGQLATAVPGVIGAVQGQKAASRQGKLLQGQSDIFNEQAAMARGLAAEAAPLRQAANARLLQRLNQPTDFSFASDRLNPFTAQFSPVSAGSAPPLPTPLSPASAGSAPAAPAALPRRRRIPRPAGGPFTPFLTAAMAT